MTRSPAQPQPPRWVMPSTADLAVLDDEQLEDRQREFAAARRHLDTGAALVAAEVARRSHRDLGYSGLAQREGVRTPEQLVERLAGVLPAEARAMVAVGELLDSPTEHLASVTTAVTAGELSVLAADAIRSGLGDPSDSVPTELLAEAASQLVSVAPLLPVRRLASQARSLRDLLDTAGIAEREEALRDRRYLRVTLQPDGMSRLTGLLDPESAAIVTDAFDLVTSPRRGGPRFVDPVAAARAELVENDPRTTEQLLADAFVELVRIAGAADPGVVYVQRRPAVNIHVDRAALESGDGAAHFEGQSSAVSVSTAQRLACSAGSIPILFDGTRAIDVGRSQRLFTDRQRLALAARDGGCRFAGCDRPPSWCEAHHTNQWMHGGSTDIAAGILLCRFHHLMVHNQGWSIEPRGDTFVALPPPGSGREELVLPSRSPVQPAREPVQRARNNVHPPRDNVQRSHDLVDA